MRSLRDWPVSERLVTSMGSMLLFLVVSITSDIHASPSTYWAVTTVIKVGFQEVQASVSLPKTANLSRR